MLTWRRWTAVALFALTLGCQNENARAGGVFVAMDEPPSPLRPPERRGEVPEDARIADYEIDARLDAEEHRIDGTMRLTWRNRTTRATSKLPFHLYMNGFRAQDTAWMAQSRGSHRNQKMKDGGWGYIDLQRVELLARGNAGTHLDPEFRASKPISLAWEEDEDPTTMVVELPEAVAPGESITVEIEFVTQMPKVFARTGYHDDFHMAGQWFPKVGVLEEDAGWQTHTFHLHSEFYADFGNYRVTLDVPQEMIVGASGIRTDEEIREGRKHLTYEAEMVHDFAWTADPDYVETFADYEGIRIRQLIQPERLADAELHLEAQKAALASYEARFGAYPWSTITIVHVPKGASGAGGMEYPTLYTTSNHNPGKDFPGVTLNRFSGLFTTVHEFGHQYFQGLFASNEHAQPWLDEGMNTTSNQLVMLDTYGPNAWAADFFGRTMGVEDELQLAMGIETRVDPIDQSAADFEFNGTYGLMTYAKTAALMITLRNLSQVGERNLWDEAMQQYCEKARFRHPKGRDLEATLVSVIGGEDGRLRLSGEGDDAVYLDVQDYLDQALRETSVLDFAVRSAANQLQMGQAGWHRDDAGKLFETELDEHFSRTSGSRLPWRNDDPPGDDHMEGVVVLHRKGGFRVPVEVRVEFTDDSSERLVWDGEDRHVTYTFAGKRVRSVFIDPDHKLLLEGRRLNNAAYADMGEHSDHLSTIMGDIHEGASLALMGGLAP